MASSNKLYATILVLSILLSSTFTNASYTCKPTPKPSPAVSPAPSPAASCSKNALKLGVCVGLLGLVNPVIGDPPSSKCCALLSGLADLEAALCLCTAIKANVLGVNLNVPLTLSVLISACQKTLPAGFKCE